MTHYPNRGLYLVCLVSADTEVLKVRRKTERFQFFLWYLSKAVLTLLGSKLDLQGTRFCRRLLLFSFLFFPLKEQTWRRRTKVLDREISNGPGILLVQIWSTKKFPSDHKNGTQGREPNGVLCAYLFQKGDFIKLLCMEGKKYTSVSKDIYRGWPWVMLSH